MQRLLQIKAMRKPSAKACVSNSPDKGEEADEEEEEEDEADLPDHREEEEEEEEDEADLAEHREEEEEEHADKATDMKNESAVRVQQVSLLVKF